MGMRTKGRPQNRRKNEVLNGLTKLKVNNWTYFVKDRKTWYELMQKTKPTGVCSVSRRKIIYQMP